MERWVKEGSESSSAVTVLDDERCKLERRAAGVRSWLLRGERRVLLRLVSVAS